MKLQKLYLPLLFVFFFTHSFSQEDYYIQKEYNISDGLIGTNINVIYQDSIGFLWFASDQGLSRFDGNAFRNFNFPDEFVSNYIIDLNQNINGNILIIDYITGKLWEFDGNEFKRFDPLESIKDSVRYSAIKKDGDRLFIGTKKSGLFLYTKDTIQRIRKDDDLLLDNVRRIEKDIKGNIFIYSTEGVLKLTEELTLKKFLPEERPKITFQHNKGYYWIATKENEIKIKRNDGWETAFALNEPIYSMKQISGGDVFVLTENNLYRIVDNFYDDTYIFPEIEKESIHTLFVDKDNNIWVSIQGQGVVRLYRNHFSNEKVPNGRNGDLVFVLTNDKTGSTWLSYLNYGLIEFKNGGVKRYPFFKDNFPRLIGAAYHTDSSIVMAGDKDIMIYNYESFKKHSTRGLPIKSYVDGMSDILYDDNKLIVAMAFDGIWEFYDSIWVQKVKYSFQKDELYSMCFFMLKDSMNGIWVGTSEGLYEYKNDTLIRRTGFDKLSISAVRCATLFPDNEIWFGTDLGAYSVKDGKLHKSFTIENGLPSNKIAGISQVEDILVITTNEGFSLIRDSIIVNLTSADGLLSNNIHGNEPVCNEGKMFIATDKGLSIFNYHSYFNDSLETQIFISSLETNKDTLTFEVLNNEYPEKIILEPGTRSLKVTFNVIDFNNIKTYHRYRLIKGNVLGEWKSLTDQEIDLLDIGYGKYWIEVESRNLTKNWRESFRIELINPKPLYLSYGSIIVYMALVLGLFYIVKKKKPEEKEKYYSSSLSELKYNFVKESLEKLFIHEKVYKDPDITLSGIAEKFKIPKEHISQVLNSEFKMNFNALINKYRIEEAKYLLLNEYDKFKSIIQIAYEVGFNSKSSFNTSFKKYTGCTPTEFRKNKGCN